LGGGLLVPEAEVGRSFLNSLEVVDVESPADFPAIELRDLEGESMGATCSLDAKWSPPARLELACGFLMKHDKVIVREGFSRGNSSGRAFGLLVFPSAGI
jgi:hypothetical protein